ncbi:hypothetical protein AUR64_02530 [Haloprofundus marisrubri]|uniref:Uncharacterized protein n=1 Tax=Haloprofundus marisrubri TaxID=1514971 RepID=A0A0W1R314_9EURY|nr:hypothetical protein AUR64_02530 [Haloprofundus marisrubri]
MLKHERAPCLSANSRHGLARASVATSSMTCSSRVRIAVTKGSEASPWSSVRVESVSTVLARS